MKVYVSKQELVWFLKAETTNTPVILEVWKDKKDFRDCFPNIHITEMNLIGRNGKISLTEKPVEPRTRLDG